MEQRKNLSYLNERIQTYEDEVSKIDKNSQEFEEVHHEVVSERLRLQNTLDSLLSEVILFSISILAEMTHLF